MDIVDVRERTPRLVEDLLGVWERSVRATHDFLAPGDVARIRGYVPKAIRGVARLAVAFAEDGRPLGFAGANGRKLEMLFVDADARGTGAGSALLRHATGVWGVRELTVNEQNPQAVGFYEHMGFVTFGRSQTDDAGEPFPLLRMRLHEPPQANANGAPSADSADAIAEGDAFLASRRPGRFTETRSLIEPAVE